VRYYVDDILFSKMKAYSIDFRQKIIDAYYSSPISLAPTSREIFSCSRFVQKLLKQYRLTGNVAPKHGGGSQLKLSPEQLARLAQLIETNNDATLAQLCQMLASQTGVVVSTATRGRMTERLKITVKKTLSPPRKRKGKSATSQI
jgi:transposase